MAHVGQKLALQAGGFFGAVARGGQFPVGNGEFGGAKRDLLFEMAVAKLDLPEHAVKDVDEHAQFVVRFLHGATRVAPPLPFGPNIRASPSSTPVASFGKAPVRLGR